MTGRERILAALDGREPDRVPLALAFYRMDGAALAPPGAWRDDLVDVGFVDFPVSDEEEELRRRALPQEGNTRIGSRVAGRALCHVAVPPRDARDGQPAGAGDEPRRPRALPVPRRRWSARRGGARPGGGRPAPAWPGGRRQHPAPRWRAVRGCLAPPGPRELPHRPRRAQGHGPLPAGPAGGPGPAQRRDARDGRRGRALTRR